MYYKEQETVVRHKRMLPDHVDFPTMSGDGANNKEVMLKVFIVGFHVFTHTRTLVKHISSLVNSLSFSSLLDSLFNRDLSCSDLDIRAAFCLLCLLTSLVHLVYIFSQEVLS